MSYHRYILSDETNFIERLTPTVARENLLRMIQRAHDQFLTIATKEQTVTFETIPRKQVLTDMARLHCIERGFQIEDLLDRQTWRPDLYFHLQNELAEVSRSSLKEKIEKAIHLNVWGQHYRFIESAPRIQSLIRTEPGTLWSIFAYQHQPLGEMLVRRYRSFVDFFRDSHFSWPHVRINELSYASYLLYGAKKWRIITDTLWVDLTYQRIVTEVILRYQSWNEIGLSLLLTNAFRSLALPDNVQKRIVRLSIAKIQELLKAPWLLPWPHFAR